VRTYRISFLRSIFQVLFSLLSGHEKNIWWSRIFFNRAQVLSRIGSNIFFRFIKKLKAPSTCLLPTAVLYTYSHSVPTVLSLVYSSVGSFLLLTNSPTATASRSSLVLFESRNFETASATNSIPFPVSSTPRSIN